MAQLLFFVGEAVRGLLHAKLMTFVSIVTIGLVLFFFGALMCTYHNLHQWLGRASERMKLVAYVKDPVAADTAALAGAAAAARSLPAVKDVTVVTKRQAWERFSAEYGSDMLSAVNDNPLPASLEITMREPYGRPQVEQTAASLRAMPQVESTTYQQEWLDRIGKFRWYLLVGGGIAFVVIGAGLAFMIENSIKLTIYARRDLITNMRLVGATDGYIELPFVIEGMLQGLVGGLAGCALVYASRMALARVGVSIDMPHYLWSLIPAGMLLGIAGSYSAVRKFLA
jgi:cell division transport system permease protein